MSLFSAIGDLLKPAPAPRPELRQALDRISELVDPVLHAANHFEATLLQPVEHALGYCAGLVDSLPGPIDINRQAFASDPLVHALFATADDIAQTLGRSEAVRDFLKQPASLESDHFYAMFVARRQQKRQLGSEQHGEVIRNDVPQQVLYFSGQTLIEPCSALPGTCEQLRNRALESLLQSFRQHVEALREERSGLRADLAIERSHSATATEAAAARHTRHLAELDAQLRDNTASLEPEHLLTALARFLLAPEPALNLAPVSVTVDRLGILRDENDDSLDTQHLNFLELSGRDRRLHLAMLARINLDEAREAVAAVNDQQHRYMLI